MRSTGKYEYVNALVRGQIGNLLGLRDYQAILGCRQPSEVVQVLRANPYYNSLTTAKVEAFTHIQEIVTSSASHGMQALITKSPESAKEILEGYLLLLESRSIINSMSIQIKDPKITWAGAIPLGAIPTEYYELQKSDIGRRKRLQSPDLDSVILESLRLAESHRCTAPLLKIVLHCGNRLLERLVQTDPAERPSMSRLVVSYIEGAVLEMVFVSVNCGIEPWIFRNWLSAQRSIKEGLLETIIDTRDTNLFLTCLKRGRYRFCLEAKPEETTDDLVERLPYCIMLQEARSALAGYPFRASTVAAGMTLRFLEARNVRLAIAGASGELARVSALKSMTIL